MKEKIKLLLANQLRRLGMWEPLLLPHVSLTTAEYCQHYYSTYSPEKVTVFEPASQIEALPLTASRPVSWKFACLEKRIVPEAFVLRLENGRVWGANGSVITKEGVLLKDLSREFGRRQLHSSFLQLSIRTPVKKGGNVAVLSTAGGGTYYHWMFDILPRFYLLEKAGVLSSIDHFIVPPIRSSFQKETLRMLGIDTTRLIEAGTDDFHLQATNLLVPSLPSLLGTVNAWASSFVRECFLQQRLPAVRTGKRIFISRKKADNRKLANEQELERWLSRNGFETIIAEDHSLQEQAAIFNNAEIVLALHGSGLSNIIFCRPGTLVIELFSASFVVPCFWILANNHSLKYCYVMDGDEDKYPLAPYWEGKATDLTISEQALDQILQRGIDIQ